MAFGEGLHTADAGKKRRTQLYALAGLGALVVVFLIIRRGSSSTSSSGYSSTDLQQAAADAAAQQAQTDQSMYGTSAYGTPSTFADNGASAANLASSVTDALGGVTTALNNLQANQAGSVPTTAAPSDATASAPAPAPVSVTVNAGSAQPQQSKQAYNTAFNTGYRAAQAKKPTVVRGSHGPATKPAGGTKTHVQAKKRR